MKILEKGKAAEGYDIQIENWNENYSFLRYGDTLVAYPKAKISLPWIFGAKRGETFRCEFNFSCYAEAQEAFKALATGQATLTDYAEYLRYKEYKEVL